MRQTPEFEEAREAFLKAGIRVAEFNEGTHWQLHYGGAVIDYWPSANKCQAYGRVFKAMPAALVSALTSGRICMPVDAGPGVCNACKAPIYWVKTINTIQPNKSGKNLPINPDGTSHHGTCTARKKTPKRAALKATRDFLDTTREVFNDPLNF